MAHFSVMDCRPFGAVCFPGPVAPVTVIVCPPRADSERIPDFFSRFFGALPTPPQGPRPAPRGPGARGPGRAPGAGPGPPVGEGPGPGPPGAGGAGPGGPWRARSS